MAVRTKTDCGTKHVGLQLRLDKLECWDVVIINNVFAVVSVLAVQPLTDPVQQGLEFCQGRVGGVDIDPVLDNFLAELTLDVLSGLQRSSWDFFKGLGAKSTQVTDFLVKIFSQQPGDFLEN